MASPQATGSIWRCEGYHETVATKITAVAPERRPWIDRSRWVTRRWWLGEIHDNALSGLFSCLDRATGTRSPGRYDQVTGGCV